MEKVFRNIVLASVALYAAYIFMPYSWSSYYPEEALNAMSWAGVGAVIETNDAFWHSIHVIYFTVSIGLLFYQNWARIGFLILTLFNAFVTPVFGVFTVYGLDSAVFIVLTLLDGCILTMAYLTSIAGKFSGNV